jgi:hypothetical protein
MGLVQLLRRLLLGDASDNARATPHTPSQQHTTSSQSSTTPSAIKTGAAAYGAAKATGALDAHSSQHFSAPAMAGTIAAYNALPPEQRTPENARELGAQMGMWDAMNSPPPPVP